MVTVSELNSKVDSLSKDCQATQGGVAIFTSAVATLTSNVATLKSDNATLKSDVATLKSDVDEIKTSLSKLTSFFMGKNPEGFAHEFGASNIPGSSF